MKPWTHRYRYKIQHSFNQVVTGRIQVIGEYSPEEVLLVAKTMNNSLGSDASILECELIELAELN